MQYNQCISVLRHVLKHQKFLVKFNWTIVLNWWQGKWQDETLGQHVFVNVYELYVYLRDSNTREVQIHVYTEAFLSMFANIALISDTVFIEMLVCKVLFTYKHL